MPVYSVFALLPRTLSTTPSQGTPENGPSRECTDDGDGDGRVWFKRTIPWLQLPGKYVPQWETHCRARRTKLPLVSFDPHHWQWRVDSIPTIPEILLGRAASSVCNIAHFHLLGSQLPPMGVYGPVCLFWVRTEATPTLGKKVQSLVLTIEHHPYKSIRHACVRVRACACVCVWHCAGSCRRAIQGPGLPRCLWWRMALVPVRGSQPDTPRWRLLQRRKVCSPSFPTV